LIQVGDGRCPLLILHCLDRPAPLLRHSVFDDKRPPLSIIEAYIGTLPADVENFLEILYDVMLLEERPELDGWKSMRSPASWKGRTRRVGRVEGRVG